MLCISMYRYKFYWSYHMLYKIFFLNNYIIDHYSIYNKLFIHIFIFQSIIFYNWISSVVLCEDCCLDFNFWYINSMLHITTVEKVIKFIATMQYLKEPNTSLRKPAKIINIEAWERLLLWYIYLLQNRPPTLICY